MIKWRSKNASLKWREGLSMMCNLFYSRLNLGQDKMEWLTLAPKAMTKVWRSKKPAILDTLKLGFCGGGGGFKGWSICSILSKIVACNWVRESPMFIPPHEPPLHGCSSPILGIWIWPVLIPFVWQKNKWYTIWIINW